ncbi:VP2 [Gyrovirus GyV7-SF]|uniref:Dual specificity protein phosphatase VP2 n=1 Tax=Gyrovirus GyV7-SF TaxID=1548711 RepID=A0A089RS37_9VIRU|nr:VP2 [Gyrovirus GyV7-SF]AIR09406.1 VP2 [Gyrovirus GyV7-SF]
MLSGGVEDTQPGCSIPAGGSELPFRQEGQRGPSGAGGPGKTLNSHGTPIHENGSTPQTPVTPSPRAHIRKTYGDVRASNKFVSVGWDSLERDPNWYRVNYNYTIATWLRNCSRTHDEICTCGSFRSHWFQECSGLTDACSQTEKDLGRLLSEGKRAKQKTTLPCNPTPHIRRKTVRWQDEQDDLADDSTLSTEDDGGYTGDEDDFADIEPVNFDLDPQDAFIAALRGDSSTQGPAPTW